MIKVFCDRCETEIKRKYKDWFLLEFAAEKFVFDVKIVAEAIVRETGIINVGNGLNNHICISCFIELVKGLDKE